MKKILYTKRLLLISMKCELVNECEV